MLIWAIVVFLCPTRVLLILLPLFSCLSYTFLHMLIFPVVFFSLRGGYHPYSSYNIGKAPTKTGLRPPHPDLITFPHQFKGTTCILCVYLRLQQPPSCTKKKAETVGFPVILFYVLLCRVPCPCFRNSIIRLHIFGVI